MCGPATAIGVATGLSQGASALGSFQQGRAQTDATNRARLNQYRDTIMMNEFQFQGQEAIRRAAINDYQAGLRESDLALGEVRTGLDKQLAERVAKSRFENLAGQQKLLQTQGRMAATMQAGRGRERAMALAAGAEGMRESLVMDNLLRARFAAADTYRGAADQATSYRRQLFSKVPLPTRRAPLPSAPVMQSGPSALSLIGGLGSAALGGLTAGMGAASDLGRIGGVPGAGTPSALVQGIDVPINQMPAGMAFP